MRELLLGVVVGIAGGVLYLATCPPPATWEPAPYAAELAYSEHHLQVDTGWAP